MPITCMLQNAGTIFTAVDITHSIPFIIHHCLQGKGSSQNRLCGAFRTLRQMFHVSQARLLGDGPIRSCKRSTHQSRCLPPNPQSLQWSIRLIQPLLCTCMCCHPNALEKRFMRPSQSPPCLPLLHKSLQSNPHNLERSRVALAHLLLQW